MDRGDNPAEDDDTKNQKNTIIRLEYAGLKYQPKILDKLCYNRNMVSPIAPLVTRRGHIRKSIKVDADGKRPPASKLVYRLVGRREVKKRRPCCNDEDRV